MILFFGSLARRKAQPPPLIARDVGMSRWQLCNQTLMISAPSNKTTMVALGPKANIASAHSLFQLAAFGGALFFRRVKMQPIGNSAIVATRIIQSPRLVSVMLSPSRCPQYTGTSNAKLKPNGHKHCFG